jgi:hypothetical protein
VSHKHEISDLIRKKIKYDEAHITKMATLIKLSPERVRKHIFGKELFGTNQEASPLSQLKQDIGY